MSVGYMGYTKFGNPFMNTGYLVLPSNAEIQKVISPIYSPSSRAAGWYNTGNFHYQEDIIQYEGSLSFDVVYEIWDVIKAWAIESRNVGREIEVSPDGIIGYRYLQRPWIPTSGLFCSSVGFSTSEGQLVTCSLGVLSFSRTTSQSGSYITNKEGLEFTSGDPIPFWETSVTISELDMTGTDVLEWSVDVTNNVIPVYGCVGVMGPIAVVAGEVSASASVSLFNFEGVSIAYHVLSDDIEVRVTVKDKELWLPRTKIENDSHPMSGSGNISSRVLNFTGLASEDPIFKME